VTTGASPAGVSPPEARAAKACPFCAIVAGTAPADIVYEDAVSLAFLDRSPLTLGHVLLIPRAHIPTLPEADDATAAALGVALRRLTAALPVALGADGTFVGQNNVVSQSVPHLHFHVAPRTRGDGLFARSMVWRRVRYRDDAQREATAQAIRAALRGEG
jgi:histidine triad (HIT) family protein